jgi:AAA+ ATPase superfamily predicted ATPase
LVEFERPEDLFDRVSEWSNLSNFASAQQPGLRLAIVSGRRRQGKSFLLRRLARSTGALYHQAQEVERFQALARFADDVGVGLGIGRGQLHFGDWETALRAALAYPERGSGAVPSPGASGSRRILVIDELPYLLAHSPEIPSVLQEIYDESHDEGDYPSAAAIICGSALSVMSELLSGSKALRGRAQLDLTLRPFDYRLARQYWGIEDPAIAFQLDAVLGGTAGYRPLIAATPPRRSDEIPGWLATSVLNPAHALFQETDYLLREDPRISDRGLYNSILLSVAAGNHTTKSIGSTIGRDHNSMRYPLQILESAGFLNKVEDLLTQKRPLYYIADPIIRFGEVVIEPYRALLEERDAETVWTRAAAAFSSAVLGPHFEQLALTWTARYSGDRWGQEIGRTGPAVVNDAAGRSQHQLDVLAFERNTQRFDVKARIVMLGEAKSTNRNRTPADLDRLERIRGLLVTRGWEAGAAHLALFSREGFDPNLTDLAAGRPDVHLIGLHDLYAAG